MRTLQDLRIVISDSSPVDYRRELIVTSGKFLFIGCTYLGFKILFT